MIYYSLLHHIFYNDKNVYFLKLWPLSLHVWKSEFPTSSIASF